MDLKYVVFERDTTRKNHSKKSTLEYKFDHDENRYKAILAERASKQRNLAKMTTAKSSSPSQRTSPRDALRRIRGAIGSISRRPR